MNPEDRIRALEEKIAAQDELLRALRESLAAQGPNALVEHLRMASAKRAKMIKAGKITGRAKGGRNPLPTNCPRCGVVQPSARIAWMHCREKRT